MGQPGTVDRTMEQPGTVDRTMEQPGTVDRTMEQPGTVDRTMGQPGTVDRTMGQPGTVDRTMEQPGTVDRTMGLGQSIAGACCMNLVGIRHIEVLELGHCSRHRLALTYRSHCYSRHLRLRKQPRG
jgi:hypothetical protein